MSVGPVDISLTWYQNWAIKGCNPWVAATIVRVPGVYKFLSWRYS